MSADNGIYILETPARDGVGKEFRVIETQAIDNIYWDTENHCETDNTKIHIKNARIWWRDSSVFRNRGDALLEADKVYKQVMGDFGIVEYGISFIEIPEVF